MASVLARQLAGLEAKQPSTKIRGKPSLLYDPIAAADLDIPTLLSSALQGLEELEKADARFGRYAKTLFSKHGAERDRALEPKETNDKLDQSLSGFLKLAAPYFLLPAAAAVLEYLVRRFSVHEYNAELLLMSFLPYHSTNQYVRLVQLVDVSKLPMWEFLANTKKNGAALPRSVLVTRCTQHPPFLEALVEHVLAARSCRTFTAFAAVLLTETLSSQPITEPQLATLLPLLKSALSSKAPLEMQASAMMIVGQMVAKTLLGPAVVDELLEALCKGAHSSLRLQALRLLLLTCRTHSLAQLPKSALAFVVKWEDLCTLLSQLAAENDPTALLLPLLTALVASPSPKRASLLARVVGEVSLPERVVTEVLRRVLRELVDVTDPPQDDDAAAITSTHRKTLKQLEQRHSEPLNQAVKEALEAAPASERAALSERLSELLTDSAARPMEALTTTKKGKREVPQTLAQAVDSPVAAMRAAALAQVAELVEKDTGKVTHSWAQQVLLRRLRDDHPSVVLAALGLPCLPQLVPAEALLQELQRLVRRSVHASKSEDRGGEVRAVGKRALKLMCRCLPAAMAPAVGRALLPMLLPAHPAGRKMAYHALANVRALPSSVTLLQGVSAAAKDELSHKHRAAAQLTDAQTCSKVLSALGSALAAAPDVCLEELRLVELESLSDSQDPMDVRHLSLLILTRALATASSADSLATLAPATWSVLEPALKSDAQSQAVGTGDADVASWEHGLPPEDFWQLISAPSSRPAALAAIAHQALTAVVAAMEKAKTQPDPAFLRQLAAACLVSTNREAPLTALLALAPPGPGGALGMLGSFLADDGAIDPTVQAGAVRAIRSRIVEATPVAASATLQDAACWMVVALSNPNRVVRVEALVCLDLAPLRSRQGVHPLTTHLASAHDALAMRAESLPEELAASLASMTPKARQEAIELLLRFACSVAEAHPAGAGALVGSLRSTEAGEEGTVFVAMYPTLSKLLLEFKDHQELSPTQGSLVFHILQACTPAGFALLQSKHSKRAEEFADLLPWLLDSAVGRQGSGDARAGGGTRAVAGALACMMQPELYQLCPASMQHKLLTALLQLAGKGEVGQGRDAARRALEGLDLSDAAVAELISAPIYSASSAPGPAPTPSKKAKRSGASSAAMDVDARPLRETMRTAVAALELLTWRSRLATTDLLPALGSLLKWLVESAAAATSAPVDISEGSQSTELAPSPVLGYMAQLALSSMQCIVEALDDSAAEAGVEVGVVVQCVVSPPGEDPGARGAGLATLRTLAARSPRQVLMPLLTMGSRLDASALHTANRALNQAVATAARAWVGAELPLEELASAFSDALPSTAAHRRALLLTGFVRAAGLTASLRLLLALHPTNDEGEEDDWPMLVADTLCSQEPAEDCLQAFVAICSTAEAAEPTPAKRRARKSTSGEQKSGEGGGVQVAALSLVAQQLQEARWRMHRGDGFGELLAAVLSELAQTSRAAVRSAATSVLEALAQLMAPAAYFLALASLMEGARSSVCRRALTLFCKKLARMGASGASATAAGQGMGKDGEGEEAVRDAVCAVCSHLPAMLESSEEGNLSTKQQALSAVEAAAKWCAAARPAPFSALLPVVLSTTAKSTNTSLQCSALVSSAAIIEALGTHMLPLLPTAAPLLLDMATALCQENENDTDEKDIDACQSAALAGVSALVQHVGAFLTPFLPKLLALLLHPSLANAPAAAALRSNLPVQVPARVLLEPVRRAWEEAARGGAPAVRSVLHVLKATLSHLDRATAKAHHTAVAEFLLTVLDLRGGEFGETASVAEMDEVEGVAVEAMLALTLKVSENSFRGIFHSVVQWGLARGGAESVGGRARLRALFRVADTLAGTLRSVMTPYFASLLGPAAAALTATSDEAQTPKKRKKEAIKRHQGTDLPSEVWALREQIVRALHKCFLHDTSVDKFVDNDRFEQVYPAIVQQIEELPEDGEESMEDTVKTCLVQLAVAAGSDTLWRPLNRAVLMVTRASKARARVAALKVVSAMAARLHEEYLVLLPETMPFLAELMEDPEEEVEAKCQELLQELAVLSGEDLQEMLA